MSVFPPLKPNVLSFLRLSEFNDIKKINERLGSSVFHETTKNGQKYFIKSITKSSNIRRNDRGVNYILKRVLNEVLATMVYNFYGLHTFDYDIIYNDINNEEIDVFSLGSSFVNGVSYKYDYSDVAQAEQVLAGFLVDCIVSNWDAGNNNNIGFLNGKAVRTDVGGALAYRGLGDLKVPFYSEATCTEHKTFFDKNLGTGRFFSNYLQTITSHNKTLRDVAYTTINAVDIKTLTTYEPILELKRKIATADIDAKYISFIDAILQRVMVRHEYYVSFGGQIGGRRKARKVVVKGSTRVYTVRADKTGKSYIVQNRQNVPLKSIRGKYRYIMEGGEEKSEIIEEPIDPEIFVSGDFFNTMMSKLTKKCAKNGGNPIINR